MTKTQMTVASSAMLSLFLSFGSPVEAAGGQPGVIRESELGGITHLHAQQFGELWLSRRQHKVTPQLLKMLASEPSPYVREHIVMALGRIEDPAALPTLQELLVKVKALGPPRPYGGHHIRRFKDVPPFQVQLAIGRIKARNLKGIPKLNTIARELGKTWPSLLQDARRLRLKLQERMGKYRVQESDDRFIVDEFYDVLYRMGKRGENIRALGAYDLLIWPQQKPLLDTAALSDQAERRFWLNWALAPTSISFRKARLLDLGAKSDELLRVLKQALAQVKANPASVAGNKRIGCRALFATAVALNDPRFLPILTQFSKIGDPYIRGEASNAVNELNSKRGLSSVIFP